MITGTTTKLSESTIIANVDTIQPKTDIVYIYGSSPIRKIMPSFGGGEAGFVCLINIGGSPLILKAWDQGNVQGLLALKGDLSIPQWTAIWLVYSKQHGVWFASALYAGVTP